MKNLTARYSATQFSYWIAISGGGSFATIFLLDKGVPSGIVGLLLAGAGLCSCLSQPVLASFIDKSKNFILTKIMIAMSLLCCFCFLCQLISAIPLFLCCILYMAALWSGDALISLMNALSVAYNDAGYTINYGVGRGIGAAATAISSLLLGHIMAAFGTIWMLLYVIIGWILYTIVLIGYPYIQKCSSVEAEKKDSCTIFSFFKRYPWYCASLAGVLFLGMYHVMTETYMIAIVTPFGGNSSHVGTALFVSAAVTFPTICLFSRIQSRIKNTNILKIAALSYVLKAVCFYFAKDILSIYLFQLLQITSYAFLAPAQVYYANAKVRSGDMVKGQAFITAAYALGCSAGNFAGGQLLNGGVETMLIAGIIIAAAGTIILFFTLEKKDFYQV